jgi:hypothetical protein
MWTRFYDVYHSTDLEYQGSVNTPEQLYDLMVGDKPDLTDLTVPFVFTGECIYVPFYARNKGHYDVDLLNGFPNIEKIAFF